MSADHLNQAAKDALELSTEDRITRILTDRWIGYSQAKEVLASMEDLLSHPRNNRMPSMLIVGDSNNGKTMLAKRFCQLHPAQDNPAGEGVLVPVMYIQAPPVPDEGRFYNAILDSLFAPYKPSERVDKKQFQVLKLLRYAQLKVLVVDEVHNILAGSMNRQRTFLNVLKYLSNELQISIVGFGTKDAFRALQTDPQMANRFKPLVLPRWEFNNEFLRLLASFEKMLPLKKPSTLHSEALASKLYAMSEGYIGELSKVLTGAAVYAVKSGKEHITFDVLAAINWTPPSERKRQIDKNY